MACFMVENSSPGTDSKQGESTSWKEKEKEEDLLLYGKRGVYPSLYRPRGVPTSSPPPCGTKLPRGGGCAGLRGAWAPPKPPSPRGDGPHPFRQAQGGEPPPPLMTPMGPYLFLI